MIALRPATMDDSERLFAWRTDAVTQFYSLTSDEIAWAAHVAWLERSFANPDRTLLIAEQDGEPFGTARIDRGAETIISVTVGPEHRAKRLSEPLLAAALPAEGAVAYIKNTNLASQRMCLAVGFVMSRDGPIQRWVHPGTAGTRKVA